MKNFDRIKINIISFWGQLTERFYSLIHDCTLTHVSILILLSNSTDSCSHFRFSFKFLTFSSKSFKPFVSSRRYSRKAKNDSTTFLRHRTLKTRLENQFKTNFKAC